MNSKVILVKPYCFDFNIETSKDNRYQNKRENVSKEDVQIKALNEFENAVRILKENGIYVDVVSDFDDTTPDSIFPNNTFVTFKDKFVIMNMYNENRKKEIEKFFPLYRKMLNIEFENIIDYRKDDRVLEGTGAMVLDRENKIAYATLSKRCDKSLFEEFCRDFSFEPCYFRAFQNGGEVYHTNVIMTMAKDYVLIAMDLLCDKYKKKLYSYFEKTNKEVIELSADEILHFAGNSIELFSDERSLLIISKDGYENLAREKLNKIENYSTIVPIDVSTISHYGGGAIRCMIAENFM